MDSHTDVPTLVSALGIPMGTNTDTHVPLLVSALGVPIFSFVDRSISMKVSTSLLNNPHLIQLLSVWKNGREFSWHVGIPEVHSESFAEILSSSVLHDLLPEHFNELATIKKYMYNGQLEVPRDNLLDFNDVVTKLKFDSLLKVIASNIAFESTDEMFDAFKRSITSDNTHMQKTCLEKFIRSFNEIPVEKILEFVPSLSHDSMSHIFQTESLHVNPESEVKLALALHAWGSIPSFRKISNLKSFVRFELIGPADLIGKIRPLCLLSDSAYASLLEKILTQNLHLAFVNGNGKIFICNTTETVSPAFRRVTSPEVLTEKFQRDFFAQAAIGFESLGKKDITFINSDNNKGIVFKEDLSFVRLKHIKTNLYQIFDWNPKSPNHSLHVESCGITSTDGYLYVKI